MILSDRSIKKLIDEKKLIIEPKAILKSASIRMHLSNQFAKPNIEKNFVEERDSYTLQPKECILGSTFETIKLPNDHIGLYDGSTTLARFGITTHMGSMLVSPGSNGNLTLEIFNASEETFLLKKQMRIGQLLIIRLDSPPEKTQPQISYYSGDLHKGLVVPKKDMIYRFFR